MTVKQIIEYTPVPVRIWTEDVTLDAMRQLEQVARLPFVHSHVAAMPDVHAGIGSTIGSVIPTRGAIVPAAVGVDIGCGMIAARLSIDANALPDSFGAVRSEIEARVPVGFGMHDECNVRTSGVARLTSGYDALIGRVPALATMMKHRDGWQRQSRGRRRRKCSARTISPGRRSGSSAGRTWAWSTKSRAPTRTSTR